jgi:hypothetical protein
MLFSYSFSKKHQLFFPLKLKLKIASTKQLFMCTMQFPASYLDKVKARLQLHNETVKSRDA